MSLMKDIQEAVEPVSVSSEVLAAHKALDPFYTAIHQTFGLEFADEFCRKNALAWGLEVDEAFARGFQTGGQLMLEVLSKYSS